MSHALALLRSKQILFKKITNELTCTRRRRDSLQVGADSPESYPEGDGGDAWTARGQADRLPDVEPGVCEDGGQEGDQRQEADSDTEAGQRPASAATAHHRSSSVSVDSNSTKLT